MEAREVLGWVIAIPGGFLIGVVATLQRSWFKRITYFVGGFAFLFGILYLVAEK